MNALKLLVLHTLNYVNITIIRSSTGRAKDELVQIYLGDITSCDPEATEPPLDVYPWYASNPESYTDDTFQSTFRLRAQRCWDYYGDPDNVEPRLPPEPYKVDPKLCSELEKLDNSRRAQRNQRKYLQERCRIILLPYLEAAVERFEKALTVAGTYELGSASAKVKDMYHPSKMKTRRLIAWSDHTITFINPEGQRRNLLAVVVAKERWGDAYNPLLAHMGIVHRNRKERREKNSVVYGIATDGFNFKIVKIDNKSKLFESCLYLFDEEWGFFLKYLDDILAEAPKQCEE